MKTSCSKQIHSSEIFNEISNTKLPLGVCIVIYNVSNNLKNYIRMYIGLYILLCIHFNDKLKPKLFEV